MLHRLDARLVAAAQRVVVAAVAGVVYDQNFDGDNFD